MFSTLRKYFIIGLVCYGLISLANQWMATKSYMVDYKDIEIMTKNNLVKDGDVKLAFANIEKLLRHKYKGRIIPRQHTQWIFVNAGGWMGSMYMLHASLFEYILFFGTAVDTSGHSGRYWANISDTLISGSYKQWNEGGLEVNMYGPGETIVHTWGEATAMQWTAGTYMVEYGRGFIPSTLTFALADTIFGTTDLVTLYYTFRIYGLGLLNEASFLYEDLLGYAHQYL